jgi:hypothetical protein
MNTRIFKILFLFNLFLFLPFISFALEGFVQCDGLTIPCTFETAVATVEKIINWILYVSVSVAAISFAYAGGEMVLFPTDPGKRNDAKSMFWKTVVGLLIILASWLVVKAAVEMLVGGGGNPLRFLQ